MNGGSIALLLTKNSESERTDFESGFNHFLFMKSWKSYFDLFPKHVYIFTWFSEWQKLGTSKNQYNHSNLIKKLVMQVGQVVFPPPQFFIGRYLFSLSLMNLPKVNSRTRPRFLKSSLLALFPS